MTINFAQNYWQKLAKESHTRSQTRKTWCIQHQTICNYRCRDVIVYLSIQTIFSIWNTNSVVEAPEIQIVPSILNLREQFMYRGKR